MSYEFGVLVSLACGIFRITRAIRAQQSIFGINLGKIGFRASLWSLEPNPMVNPQINLSSALVAVIFWQLVVLPLSWVYVLAFLALELKKVISNAEKGVEVREAIWKLRTVLLTEDQAAREFAIVQRSDPTERELYYYEIKKHILELSQKRAG